MAFKLKRGEDLAGALVRASGEIVEEAIADIRTEPEAIAVHSARKAIKSLRAILRIVREEIGRDSFEQLMAFLREPAGLLAPARDTEVVLATFHALGQKMRGSALHRKGWARIEKHLKEARQRELERVKQLRLLEVVERSLADFPRLFSQIEIHGESWAELGLGIKKTYKRGVAALKLARKASTPENLHDWRRRIKELGYQIRLISRIEPKALKRLGKQLDGLAEVLGDYHDLVSLERAARGSITRTDRITFERVLHKRMKKLQAKAFECGDRVYEEEPGRFFKSLTKYWRKFRQK